tara:strand:+ start:3582 stop:3884 length:303 start_codon:yes stop_codon:yes gene_type:complete
MSTKPSLRRQGTAYDFLPFMREEIITYLKQSGLILTNGTPYQAGSRKAKNEVRISDQHGELGRILEDTLIAYDPLQEERIEATQALKKLIEITNTPRIFL